MKQPLLPVAVLYVLGIMIAHWAPPVALLPLFLVAFVILATALAWTRARTILLVALLVLAGWINLSLRTTILSPNDLRTLLPPPASDLATVRGILVNTPVRRAHPGKNKDYESTTVQLDVIVVAIGDAQWRPAFGRIVTTTTGLLPDNFFAGQTVEVAGTLGPPTPPVAEGLFDYPAYLDNLGIHHELHVRAIGAWKILSTPARPPLADRFSQWARKTLAKGLPVEDQTLRLEWALTLGWRQELTDEVSEPFIKAATYHIFAVDGLRIAIIAGILISLLRAIGIPRAMCGLLVLPALWFYAALTGWPASAVRAIVMITVVFGGWALNRPGDLINSLMAAALVILVWEPRQLFQAGFQLSFLVVLCIILIQPLFEEVGRWLLRADPLLPDELRPRWQKVLRAPAAYCVDLFLTSTAAWLGSIPLVAYYFHLITPVSGPANMMAVPLCGLVLIANLASLLLGAWFTWAPVLFNHAGWFFMRSIEITSGRCAGWPGAWFYLPMPGFFTLTVYYVVLLAAMTGWLFRGNRRTWKIASAAALAAVWCVLWLHQRPVTRMTVLPLGDGHAVHLVSSGFRNEWLVDCGDEELVDTVVAPFLHAQGVNRMASFIVTHGEIGYTGGAAHFAEIFEPRNIYASEVRSRSPSYKGFEENATFRRDWKPPLRLGDVVGPWTVLHPDPSAPLPKGEDNAVVLRAEIDGVRILLLSDIGKPGQRTLLEGTNDLRADLVVAGVPDQGEPLGDTLLGLIQPQVIIVADSQSDARRRANRALKDRLAQRGVPVIYTSDSRAVTVELRPRRWELQTMDGTLLAGRPGAGQK
jgi:competence protein ComEC